MSMSGMRCLGLGEYRLKIIPWKKYLFIALVVVLAIIVCDCAIFFYVCHEQAVGAFYSLSDFNLTEETAPGVANMSFAMSALFALASAMCMIIRRIKYCQKKAKSKK